MRQLSRALQPPRRAPRPPRSHLLLTPLAQPLLFFLSSVLLGLAVAEGDTPLVERGVATVRLMCENEPSVPAALASEGGLAYLASFFRRKFPEVSRISLSLLLHKEDCLFLLIAACCFSRRPP